MVHTSQKWLGNEIRKVHNNGENNLEDY